MPTSYYLPNIRTLLMEGFTVEELRDFCRNVTDYRPLYDKLGENKGKVEIVDALLEHADQKSLYEPLLAWAKETNPAEYSKYQPYTNLPPSSLPLPSDSDSSWSGAIIGGLIGASVSLIVGGGCALMQLSSFSPNPAFLIRALAPFIALSLGWLITGSLAGRLGEDRVLNNIYGEPT